MKGDGMAVMRWWLGWLMAGWVGAAMAEEPLPPVTADHVVTVFGVEDGLEAPALASVTHGRLDGRVWVGSFGGLWTYDGRGFEDRMAWMGAEGGPPVIRALMTDGAGRVWVGGAGKILVHDGRAGRLYGRAEGVPDHLVWDLAEAGEGEVWAALTTGLIRLRDGRFEGVPGPGVLADGETYRVLGEGGRAWCMGREVLARREGDGWVTMARAEPGGAGRLMGMGRATGGGLWVAYETEVRLFREGHGVKAWGRPPGARGDAVRLIEDGRGNLWMGGWQHGVTVFAPDGRARLFGREQGLPNASVAGLAEDAEGNVWVATNGGGLVRLRPLAFRTLGLESGIRQGVNHLLEASPGRFLLATQGDGIQELRDGRAMPDKDRKPGGDPLHPWVTVLHQDREGVVWAALTGVGLGRRDAGGWRVMPVDQIGAQQVMSLHGDASGRLWVGTVAGVAMGVQGRFQPMGPESKAPHAIILSMAEDGRGDLWFSGNQWGLFRFRAGIFERMTMPGMATNAGYGAVLRARDGSIWIAAGEAGLAWVRDGKPTTLGTAQGLAGLDYGGLVEDDDGHVWAVSRTVVARITRESAEAVATGRGQALDVRYFDARDGLGMVSGQSWWQGMLRASDGRLWFTTHRGLAVVDPRRLPVRVAAPAVEIEEIRGASGEALGREGGQAIELPGRGHLLDVRHRARVLGTPEKVRFESRLLPGGGWRGVGGSRNTLLRDLRPGSYRLEVRATLNGLEWGEPARVSFVVRPPFWATWWFVGCCVVCGAGAVGLGVRGVVRVRYRARIKGLEREAAIDRERARIARDLHDDLGATMTQVALALEKAVGPGGAEGDRWGLVQEGLEATRRGMASLGATVWAIRPGKQDVADLGCYLADHATVFLRRSGIECEVDVAGDLPPRPVSAEVRHHVVMMVREALNNVVRHAGARRVRFGIAVEERGLRVEVSDDGRGLGAGVATGPGGHGLRNLRERAAVVGAALSVESGLGAGTRVLILLPWTALG